MPEVTAILTFQHLKKGFSHSGVFDKLYQTLSTCITNSIIQL